MHSTSVWLSSLAICSHGRLDSAATMFAAHASSEAAALPQLTMDQLDEKQKPLGEQIMESIERRIGGPYNPMIRSPVLGRRLYDLFYYLRWQDLGADKTQRVRDPDHQAAMDLAGRVVRACAAGGEGQVVLRHHRRIEGDKRPSRNMAGDEAIVHDFVTELTDEEGFR